MLKKTLILLLIIITFALITAQVTKYQVNSKNCIGCGLCVQTKTCPTNAITMKSGKAVIDADKCIGCGICKNGNQSNYKGCPVEAINSYEIADKKAETVNNTAVKPETVKKENKDVTKTEKAVKSDSVKTAVQEKKEENIIKKIVYFVESKTCIGCRLCVSSCPVKAISMQNGKAVIDTEKCISCGLCKNGNPSTGYKGCPVDAIKTK